MIVILLNWCLTVQNKILNVLKDGKLSLGLNLAEFVNFMKFCTNHIFFYFQFSQQGIDEFGEKESSSSLPFNHLVYIIQLGDAVPVLLYSIPVKGAIPVEGATESLELAIHAERGKLKLEKGNAFQFVI